MPDNKENSKAEQLQQQLDTLANSLRNQGPDSFAESFEAFLDENPQRVEDRELFEGEQPFMVTGLVTDAPEQPAHTPSEFIHRLKQSEDPNRRQLGSKLENNLLMSKIREPMREAKTKRQRARQRISQVQKRIQNAQVSEREQLEQRRESVLEFNDTLDKVDASTEEGANSLIQAGLLLDLPENFVRKTVKAEAKRDRRQKQQQQKKQQMKNLQRQLDLKETVQDMSLAQQEEQRERQKHRSEMQKKKKQQIINQLISGVPSGKAKKELKPFAEEFINSKHRYNKALQTLPEDKREKVQDAMEVERSRLDETQFGFEPNFGLGPLPKKTLRDLNVDSEKLNQIANLFQQKERKKKKFERERKFRVVGTESEVQKSMQEIHNAIDEVGGKLNFTKKEQQNLLRAAKKIQQEKNIPLDNAARLVGKSAGIHSQFKNTSIEKSVNQIIKKDQTDIQKKYIDRFNSQLEALRDTFQPDVVNEMFTGKESTPDGNKVIGPESHIDQSFTNFKKALADQGGWFDQGLHGNTFPQQMKNWLSVFNENNVRDLVRRNFFEVADTLKKGGANSDVQEALINFYEEPDKLSNQKDRASKGGNINFDALRPKVEAGLITEDELVNPVRMRTLKDAAEDIEGEGDKTITKMKKVARQAQSPSVIEQGGRRVTVDGKKRVQGANRNDISSKIRAFFDPKQFDSFVDGLVEVKEDQIERLNSHFISEGKQVPNIKSVKQNVRSAAKEYYRSRFTDVLNQALGQSYTPDELFGMNRFSDQKTFQKLNGLRLKDEDYLEANDQMNDMLIKDIIDGRPLELSNVSDSTFTIDKQQLSPTGKVIFRRAVENGNIKMTERLLNDQYRSLKAMRQNIKGKIDSLELGPREGGN